MAINTLEAGVTTFATVTSSEFSQNFPRKFSANSEKFQVRIASMYMLLVVVLKVHI
jgi:hypothetical protein